MQSAILPNGTLIGAESYDEDVHGVRLNCLDKSCRVPVFFIKTSENQVAHFKTSGKGNSIHKTACGFARKLTFEEAVSKVSEYQSDLKVHGIKEQVIRLNLNSIDPDYIPKGKNVEPEEDEAKPKKEPGVEIKEKKPTPQSIGSLQTVKKIFTTVDPDLLASIIVSVKGLRIPISELIRPHAEAHAALWNGETLEVPYFIHGQIDKVVRLDKVWYINFTSIDDTFFSLILFKRYFKHFTLKDSELIGKNILAYGTLKMNEYNKDKPSTEMIIKSDKYIQFL